MATGILSITNTSFPDGTVIDGAAHITNFNDILDYINNRNDGTDEWKVCNVTATTTAAMTVSGNQATTLLQINNTATDGDSVLQFALSGTVGIAMGIDDGDSDAFKIGTTAIGTNTSFKIDTTGAITKPLQPSFLVTAPVNTANVTGDGTAFTVEFDAEIYDQNADFNTGTFTFTAPVAGRYLFSATVLTQGSVAATHSSGQIQLVTSNRTYQGTRFDQVDLGGSGFDTWQVTAVADMDASDTAHVTITVAGGTKVVELFDGAVNNFFSGSLIN